MLLTDRGHLFRVTVLAPFCSQSSTQSCHVSFHPDCEIRSLLQSGATVWPIHLSSPQMIASFHRTAFFEWSHSFLARSMLWRWQTTLKYFSCRLRKVHHLTPRLGPCLCLVGQCRWGTGLLSASLSICWHWDQLVPAPLAPSTEPNSNWYSQWNPLDALV